jgi:metal-responsive CopG/Arc/MetJ family transcriptional regulator
MMRQEFLAEIDKAFPLAGFNDRSSFIRNAVYKELLTM